MNASNEISKIVTNSMSISAFSKIVTYTAAA